MTAPIVPNSDPVAPPTSTPESGPERTSTPPRPGMELPAPGDSYVKLAMRNMVAKGGQSLKHFGLTVMGLLGLLVGLAFLTH